MMPPEPALTDANPFPDPKGRKAHLNHCMKVSLKKRWLWIAAGAAGAFVVTALAAGLNAVPAVSALATALLITLGIALDSRRRHQND